MTEQNECRRCGGCCLGGGPALHHDDIPLLDQGVLQTGQLLTLRRGEPAFDQPAGVVAPLPEEIIKLQYAPDGKACMHYRHEDQACVIYEQRPLECRLQACWDDSAISSAYDKGRIRRSDLLPPQSAALELARMHEEQCNFEELARKAADLFEKSGQEREAAILDILERDAAIRMGLARRLEQPEIVIQGYCLFLFGRPMRESLPFFGLRLVSRDGKPGLLRWRSKGQGYASPHQMAGETGPDDGKV